MKKSVSLLLSVLMVISFITSMPVMVLAASESDLIFELNEDGKSYSVTGCDESAEGKVVIPDTYKGLPVTGICECAFFWCDMITSVIIPDSIITIEEEPFYHCSELKEIQVDENNKYYCSVDGVLFNKSKTILIKHPDNYDSSYTIPNGVTRLEGWSFAISSLTSVTFPDSLKSIGCCAFVKSSKLKAIKIPDSVTTIDKEAFSYCHSLSSVTIGKGVTEVGSMAFFGCESLKEITIPKNVKTIGECAFGFAYQPITLTIHGVKGSAAETYAKENDLTFIEIKKPAQPTLESIENTQYGVLIKWSKVSSAVTYRVYRKTSKSDWAYIDSTGKTYYTDKTAKSGTKYYYAIKAKNEVGNSNLSNSLSKYYLADTTLNAPTSTSKGIGLRWSKVAGSQGYMVYRKTANGSYKRIATEKGVSNISFRDTTAKKGTKYYYKVKAYYSKTYSAYSNTKSVTDKY